MSCSGSIRSLTLSGTSATRRMGPGVRRDDEKILRSSTLNFSIPYPRRRNLTYLDRVLSSEGALSRSDPKADRAKAGRTGAPRTVRQAGGLGGAPGGAASYVTGRARLALSAVRGEATSSPPGGAACASWRLPPLPPRRRGLPA